jgi:hypothetical protein
MPFAFSLDGSQRLEGTGAIEWVEGDGKSGGMRFVDVSPEFRSALGQWLSSDSHRHSAGREVTPAAATPLDTMDKIRQELRSGYSQRPTEAPAEPAVIKEKSVPRIPERNSNPVIPERKSEAKETNTASRLFPLPSAPSPAAEKPAAVSSAFLKVPVATKLAAPIAPSASMISSPAENVVPEVSINSAVHVQSRPYIPPLEDSFEHAWERAKLTAPPDSPHLSRAAAGSIIAIALAAILGALAYNFRQDIGGIFIQMGQSISGDNRTAGPAPAPVQETKPEKQTSDDQGTSQKSQQSAAQPQDVPVDSGNTAKPSATPPNPKSEGGSAPQDVTSVPADVKPTGSSTANPKTELATKSGAPADAGIGQEEFNAAREILRGSNRQRELPRAVALLWAGVRLGYVPAEVTLADLFRRGDGVQKNCDQARVLLVAASKKGSFEARQMLEQIAERGCE